MEIECARHKIWKVFAIVVFWLATSTCTPAGTGGKNTPTSAPHNKTLIRVSVYHLSVDPASRQPVVSLVDANENRAFPIWIGIAEARAIHYELEGIETFRPLTHDLLAGIIGKMDGKIQRVVITRIENNVFYATVSIEKDNTTIEIDARPSDSIVMALKFNAPIYVTASLFNKMSIPLDARRDSGDDYGMNIQDITPELAGCLSLSTSRGVMVSAVRPGSRAEKDGLKTGDILVEIDGQRIEDVVSARELMEKSNATMKAKIIRGKQKKSITLHYFQAQ